MALGSKIDKVNMCRGGWRIHLLPIDRPGGMLVPKPPPPYATIALMIREVGKGN
jgi:hypothetical protein